MDKKLPAKILSPFFPTARLPYVPKKYYFTTNYSKNSLHKETVILNYIGGDPMSYSMSN